MSTLGLTKLKLEGQQCDYDEGVRGENPAPRIPYTPTNALEARALGVAIEFCRNWIDGIDAREENAIPELVMLLLGFAKEERIKK